MAGTSHSIEQGTAKGVEQALRRLFESNAQFNELSVVIEQHLRKTADIDIGILAIGDYCVQCHGLEVFSSVSYTACVEFALNYQPEEPPT